MNKINKNPAQINKTAPLPSNIKQQGKKIAAHVLVFLISWALLPAAEKITLNQAIKDGLALDFSWHNTDLDLKSAALQREQAVKGKKLRLDFEAGYRYQSQTMEIITPSFQIPGQTSIPGQTIEAGLHHNFDFKMGITQPLFTGGILTNSIKMEDIRAAISQNSRDLKRIEISDRIKNSYFSFLILKKKKQSLLTLQKSLELHRDRLENLFREGMVRKTDLLETLTKIEEINLNLNDLEQKLENEELYFRYLCGHNPEDIQAGYKEITLGPADSLHYFQTRHPVLLTMRKQRDALEVQKRILNGSYLPQIFGFAEMHYGKPGIDFFEKKWSLYFQGGISIKLPVFDWNRRRGENSVLEIKISKLENQEKQFVRDITKSLDQLYAAQKNLENKLKLMEDIIRYSREDAELKSGLYREKQATNRDYLDALLRQENNAIKKEEILTQIQQIKININSLIGRIEEEQ